MSSPTQPRSLAANSHGFFLSSPSSPCLTALSMVASSKHTGELAGRAKVPALSGQCGGAGRGHWPGLRGWPHCRQPGSAEAGLGSGRPSAPGAVADPCGGQRAGQAWLPAPACRVSESRVCQEGALFWKPCGCKAGSSLTSFSERQQSARWASAPLSPPSQRG